METKRVMVLTCSTRPGAMGPVIARWVMEALTPASPEMGAVLVPVSLGDLALPLLDEADHPASGVYAHAHTKAWSRVVDSVDGFIVVIPEYNYGMPATLKNALDYLGREWAWKPMAFVSYGNTSAGTRSVQHAKQVITTLRLVPAGATVAIRLSEAVAGGELVPDSRRDDAAKGMFAEVAALARALEPMRRSLASDSAAGPLPGSILTRLAPRDASHVTVLQRCCWVDEAQVNRALDLAPLVEAPQEVHDWLGAWDCWGLWVSGRLVGMVRARAEGSRWEMGRLGVAPDMRGQGVGRFLLRHALSSARSSCTEATVTTGAASTRNIQLYQAEGFARLDIEGSRHVTLTRPLVASEPS